MKYSILTMLIVLGAATSAHATKARLGALGQNTNGSYYLIDGRNIFLNPAAVHQVSPFLNFEMGSATGTPNAEGGFLLAGDTFRYGVQLGRRGQTATDISSVNTAVGYALITPQNTVDFVIGGSTPMLNWGAGVLYGTSKSPAATAGGFPNREASSIEIRGGVKMNQADGYLHLTPSASAKDQTGPTNTDEYKPSMAVRVGGGYDLEGGWRGFADVQSRTAKAESTSGTVRSELGFTGYTLGIANQSKLDETTRMFYSAGLMISTNRTKNELTNVETKTERTSIPLTIGLEGEGATWLTWRASVSQNVLIDSRKVANTDEHNPNTTTIGVGAGFKFNKFLLDTTLAAAANGNVDASAGNFLTNASLTYPF